MVRTSKASSARVKELTRALATMRFVTSFAFGCGGTVRILHLDVLDLNVTTIGAIMAAYSLMIAIVEVPSGAVSDVWGRRKTKLLASWVMAGAYLILASASGLVDVLVSAALLGTGRALYSGAADAWFVDEVGDAKSPAVLAGFAKSEAAHNIGFAAGSLTGAFLPQLTSGTLPDRLVFAPVFALGAAMLLVDLVLTLRVMVENRKPHHMPLGGVYRTTIAGIANALDSSIPRWTAVSMVVVGGSVACTELLTPLGLAEGVGTERALLFFGPLVAGSWGFSAVASLLTNRVESAAGSLQRASGLSMVVLALAVLPAALEAWYMPVVAYVTVTFVLGALLPLLAASLHGHVRSANRATAASVLNLSMMLGAAGGSVLVGALEGLSVVVVAIGGAIAASALVLSPSIRTETDAVANLNEEPVASQK